MSIKIGNIEIKNKVFLAPMAGVCNIPFRILCKENGAGLIYAEMVSDKALIHGNVKTLKMIDVVDEERPLSMQIFGATKESIVEGAKIIDKESNADIIDINMGCPVPKVAKKAQAGSALLKNPELIYEIVKEVVENVSKPVTCKIRIGWDYDSINAIDVAKAIEKAGAKLIAVHGRTRSQMYEGKADWEIIKKVKESINIPVIGNGDITNPVFAKEMLEYSKVDGIMIGRGALGNPFIFDDINHYLKSGKLKDKRSYEEIKPTILRHAKMLIELKGEKVGILEMRSHLAWYLKGYKNSKIIKREITNINTYNNLVKIINMYNEDKKNKF